MTGTIEYIFGDDMESADDMMTFCADCLTECGLRTRLGNVPSPIGFCSVKCEPIDSVEIICVIENFYDVEFSQDDNDSLCKLTKRGFLRLDEMAKWLRDCHANNNRVAKAVKESEGANE